MATDALRTCKDCNLTANTEEELNLFVKCDRHTHGRRNLCYKCENKRENAWRAKNGESILRKRRKHYAEKAVTSVKCVVAKINFVMTTTTRICSSGVYYVTSVIGL